MKIGKFFAKIAELASKRDILTQKVIDQAKRADPDINITHAGQLTGKQIEAALGGEEQKRYRQLSDQLDMYIPNPGMVPGYPPDTAAWATKMAKYWQTNAGYIKKEINKLDNDKYSIIITRHPIDVMRMSDFDSIASCHSPPSRSGGSGEYYKCAVAEARGHGAIAYVVETEDLLHLTNTSNIESAEQEIQEGEIFADEERGSGIGLHGDLRPLSRLRLRQVRYYDTDKPKRWDEGTEVAMPERRIYGAAIPGLDERVTSWAKENQEKVIEGMPTPEGEPDMIDLNKFWIFGGSYEDTQGEEGRKALMAKLTGKPELDFEGSMHQDTTTENQIDANAISGLAGRYSTEVEQIENEWNQHYAAVGVSASVEDDGDGGVYIEVEARITFKYDIDEFTGLPNSYPTGMHAFDSINDIWGDIFDVDSGFVNKFSNTTVHVGCRFNLEHPDIGESAIMYDPDGFNTFCGNP